LGGLAVFLFGFFLLHRFAIFGAVRLARGEDRGEGPYAAEVFDHFFYVFVAEAEDFEIGRMVAGVIGQDVIKETVPDTLFRPEKFRCSSDAQFATLIGYDGRMYGLPNGIDLSFFVGKTLNVVSFATNVIHFKFDGGVGINLESSFQHQQKIDVEQNQIGTIQSVYLIQTSSLIQLANHTVVSAIGTDDGTLTLTFDHGHVLKCLDPSRDYESYNFTDGKQLWIV